MPQLNYFLIFSQLTDLFSFLTVSVNLRLANFFPADFRPAIILQQRQPDLAAEGTSDHEY